MDENLEKKIISLAKKIKGLPEIDKKNVIEFAQNAEWGLALDVLCNQIYEHEIEITKETYEDIMKIANQMNMSKTAWEFLKELIR
jgi:hypothetical protein